MRTFRFNIIRSPIGNFTWVLLESRDGVARVVALSGRRYRSARKTRKAIKRLQASVAGAEIFAPGDGDLCQLPDSVFAVDTSAVPLVVGQVFGRRRRRKKDAGSVSTRAKEPRPVASTSSSKATNAAQEAPGEHSAQTTMRARQDRATTRAPAKRPAKRTASASTGR
jgi:hypothetical protein